GEDLPVRLQREVRREEDQVAPGACERLLAREARGDHRPDRDDDGPCVQREEDSPEHLRRGRGSLVPYRSRAPCGARCERLRARDAHGLCNTPCSPSRCATWLADTINSRPITPLKSPAAVPSDSPSEARIVR